MKLFTENINTGTCSDGPSTGSIVEEAVSRYSLDTIGNKFISTTGYGDQSNAFSSCLIQQTSSIADDIACNKELTKKCWIWHRFLLPAEVIVNEDDLAETIKKWLPNRVKTIGWKSRKGASINVEIGKMMVFWFWLSRRTTNASL
jgi:cyanophycin synthetase